MSIGKRLEKMEKGLTNRGECTCPKRTRLILPGDFPGKTKTEKGPDSGICEKCGGRWENVVIQVVWDEQGQETAKPRKRS